MGIHLSDAAHRHIAAFSDLTGVVPTDCIVEEPLTFVIPPDDMAQAIGPDGETVQAVEAEFDSAVVLVAASEHPEDFIANALEPAVIEEISIEESGGQLIAEVAVDDRDLGLAIGTDGQRIDRARTLAARHFGIDDITIRAANAHA